MLDLENMNKVLKNKENQIVQLTVLVNEKDQILSQLNNTMKEQFETVSKRNMEIEKNLSSKNALVEEFK